MHPRIGWGNVCECERLLFSMLTMHEDIQLNSSTFNLLTEYFPSILLSIVCIR